MPEHTVCACVTMYAAANSTSNFEAELDTLPDEHFLAGEKVGSSVTPGESSLTELQTGCLLYLSQV